MADLSPALPAIFADVPRSRHERQLLAALADHSPFLWQLVESDPARCEAILNEDPVRSLAAILDGLAAEPPADEATAMRRLRHARQSVALLVALADLGGAWAHHEVVGALTRAAEAFIAYALAFALRRAMRMAEPPPDTCGLCILALGKLGGHDLNYSSDVDLIALFDPQVTSLVGPDRAKPFFAAVVRDLSRILQQATADGHVLRVDLRLRPEPSASAVALSVEAALDYYERCGQNWERAALIKARPVAGDLAVGSRVLAALVPFIWRKYLDFATVADIHAMKRQIHAAKGGGSIAVAGHDVKLGRGGIRDIEFFVQTQQLVFGGKNPKLRGSGTLPMLRALHREGWIGAHAADDLARAYEFLRRVEHRLQMLTDAQTHRLPHTADALDRFARFCGFASAADFSHVLERHLRLVAHHYALLFESGPALDAKSGSLSFTGPAGDPETIATLTRMGFKAPEVAADTVRTWHGGRRAAVGTASARERLTELVPKLLATLAGTADPDAALANFDRALERMPAAGELFAILSANAALRSLHGDILGGAPLLADAVCAHPHLLDFAIDPAAAPCRDEADAAARVAAALGSITDAEEVLDALRDVRREEHFLVGLRLFSGALSPQAAGEAYSALAAAVVRSVLASVTAAFRAAHGWPPGAALSLLALGRLGSREMTATSDLDLMLVYDFDPERPESDGAKPLHAQTFFMRLTQRLISGLTVPTRRGLLYSVDMRLRPSGNQGPLATKWSAFVAYQRTTADTWEHMALLRARPIAGDEALGARLADAIAAILGGAPRATLRADVVAMRALLAREKPDGGAWDLKFAPGGLLDIEFLVQFLALREAARHPAILDPSTRETLRRLVRAGVLDAAEGEALLAAHLLLGDTQHMLRLALPPDRSPDAAGRAVKLRVAKAAGRPSFAQLRKDLDGARETVERISTRYLQPAE